MTNWIAVLPSCKPDGCLLWTQSDTGSRATLCHLFTLLVIVICLFLDPFRGCGSVGAETSALVPVQGSSHQQPWQQRLHHTQQALHVQQRWRSRMVFGAGLLLIYLLCVCPDYSVNFETLSWDSEQNWFPHSICVISLDFTPLRGRVRSHPFCLIQEQSYQAVHKTQDTHKDMSSCLHTQRAHTCTLFIPTWCQSEIPGGEERPRQCSVSHKDTPQEVRALILNRLPSH